MKTIFIKKTVSFILVIALFVSLTGCAGMTNQEKGTGIGAAFGGIAGALLCKRSPALCALGGIVIGGVLGNIIGSYMDRQVATEQQARLKYQYELAQTPSEPFLKLEDVSATPKPVAAGTKETVKTTYTALSPNRQPVHITEVHYMTDTDEDKYPISKPHECDVKPGSHESTYSFKIPEKLEAGNYKLITEISDGVNTRTDVQPIILTKSIGYLDHPKHSQMD